MNILETLENELREWEHGGTYPAVVHPNGVFSSKYTPEVDFLNTKLNEMQRGTILPQLRSAVKKLEKVRISQGPLAFEEALKYADGIRVRTGTTENGETATGLGFWVKTDSGYHEEQPPEWLWPVCRAMGNLLESRLECARFLACPPSFAFESGEFSTRGLVNLVNDTNFTYDAHRHNLRSSVVLPSNFPGRKLKVQLMLGESSSRMIFDVKYMAFGLERDGKQDKFDVVVELDAAGNPSDIPHYEKALPVAKQIYMVRAKHDLADCLQGYQEAMAYKRIGVSGRYRFELDGMDGVKQVFETDKLNMVRNLEIVLNDPRLLGGLPLQRAITHVRAYANELRNMYFKFRAGKMDFPRREQYA
ncbi:MAG: hypothetical protein ABIA93_02700 [Candidatus Woesearchaeota archaeon]